MVARTVTVSPRSRNLTFPNSNVFSTSSFSSASRLLLAATGSLPPGSPLSDQPWSYDLEGEQSPGDGEEPTRNIGQTSRVSEHEPLSPLKSRKEEKRHRVSEPFQSLLSFRPHLSTSQSSVPPPTLFHRKTRRRGVPCLDEEGRNIRSYVYHL